ncbi:MAG: glutathione S-transferase family protein, partial [Alphaproteobacteria bacterium]|nr:glutathione S-transferase family protein [Alphaproteobacteria bacterium]
EDKRLPADIDLAHADFLAMASVLDEHMKGREFIVGNSISVADCVTAYLMDWANEQKLLENMPQLQNYLDRLYARNNAPSRISKALADLPSAA